ncbi:peptidase M56 family protein [Arthrobacter crusticola]|uniref:Peptidase M56 family protein n=1 Tax=Arthrobacter crusticola TaxID=2547960 RepID=A0A4R5TPM4_9MICC|nr:peptidase M56 family protein [Arthrobacter crusticola]TDK24098.1 peptidase M56 family protein [Arthrobacter crusticola]
MNLERMDDTFGKGLRSVLVSQVNEASPARRRRHRWWVGTGIFAGVGLIGGVGAAAAGFFTEPGADIVTQVAAASEGVHTGTQTIDLGPAPEGATHISTELTCLSAGTLYWEDGASMGCGADHIESWPALYTMPLKPGQHSTEIRTSAPEVRFRLKATYVNQTPTKWAVNENGDTYGVENEQGAPDLMSVFATKGKVGYAYTEELNKANGTSAEFTSPAEALAWQDARRGKSFSVPVYESDGETVIGEFVIESLPELSEGG